MDTIKPGYKTTEFWLSLLALVLGAVAAAGVLPDGGLATQVIGGILAILSQLGYTASRAKLKADPLPPPEV